MIKFYRKIRQGLFFNEKITKYFLYALGEIILVVIGILIALQINNWNQDRIDREQELKLLSELRDDLLETRNDLFTDIEKAQKIMATTNDIFKAITTEQISATHPYQLATSYILESSMLFPKLSAYEAIQSEGITIISNDDLRTKITDLYQLHLKRIASAESYLNNLDNNVLKPYLHTVSDSGTNCPDCKDLYSLYNSDQSNQNNFYLLSEADDQIVHILKEKFNVYRTLNQRYEELSGFIDEIIDLVDQESDS